jgi:hypothetical protein
MRYHIPSGKGSGFIGSYLNAFGFIGSIKIGSAIIGWR